MYRIHYTLYNTVPSYDLYGVEKINDNIINLT